jgi:hypothetical protein
MRAVAGNAPSLSAESARLAIVERALQRRLGAARILECKHEAALPVRGRRFASP